MSSEEVDQVRKHLTILRTAKGISQSELAARVGVNQAQISRLENGEKVDISLSMLVKICQELGVLVESVIDPVMFTDQLLEIYQQGENTSQPLEELKDANFSAPASVPRIDNPYTPGENNIPIGVDEDRKVVAINNDLLNRHMMVVGKTGHGKSEWLKWVFHGIANSDSAAILLDPNGWISDAMLNNLIVNSPERAKDILFIDFTDKQYSVAVNPLTVTGKQDIEAAVNRVLLLFSNPNLQFSKHNAPRATQYLRNALTCLCHANLIIQEPENKLTIYDLRRFFKDDEFRQVLIEVTQDPEVEKTFGKNSTFETLSEQQQLQYIKPILRVFEEITASLPSETVFSNPFNKLDFTKWISEKKIIIIKFASFTARYEERMPYLASLVLDQLLSTVEDWGRKKDPHDVTFTGNSCRVVVDEAPTVFSPGSSVPEVLAEARKWDLGLIMSAQFTEQFEDQVAAALLANVASKISFAQDKNVSKDFKTAIMKSYNNSGLLATLPMFEFYANILTEDNQRIKASGAFKASALPILSSKLTAEQNQLRQQIIRYSQEESAVLSSAVNPEPSERDTTAYQILKKHLRQ